MTNFCCTSSHRLSTQSISSNYIHFLSAADDEVSRDICTTDTLPELPARDYNRNEPMLLQERCPNLGLHSCLDDNYTKLKKCGWYWGTLNWSDSETMLTSRPNGSFLVRDSAHTHHLHTLSVKCNDTIYHIRIQHSKGHFYIFSEPERLTFSYGDIVTLIERVMKLSVPGRYILYLSQSEPGQAPIPIRLLYPVSQLYEVSSLQHICRRSVLNIMPGKLDSIKELTLPDRLKEYLLQPNGYFIDTTGKHAYLGCPSV